MCYPACRIVHMKDPLLLFGSSCSTTWCEWVAPRLYASSLLPYVRRHINELNVSLIKTFPFFLLSRIDTFISIKQVST